MTEFVAMLRGIAPGNPRTRNAQLKLACEAIGLRNVETVISSGNVIFDADQADARALESTLEAAWNDRLGFESTTIVRRRQELEELVALQPFGTLEHGPTTYLLVTFSKHALDIGLELPHRPEGTTHQLVAATARELFTVSDTTGQTPDVMSWIDRRFGKAVTSRTWLTVGRLIKRMG